MARDRAASWDRPERVATWHPGWYRFTPAGWEYLTDAEAQELIDDGHAIDLVHVETVAEDVPLFDLEGNP
jgi:hypothetical protein